MLVRVTPPAPIVAYEEAKAHLRLDHDDEKTYVEALIATATETLDGKEGGLGRAFGQQTWKQYSRCWPCGGVIEFKLRPVQSITKISYVHADGTESDVPAVSYSTLLTDSAGTPYIRFASGFDYVGLADRDDAVSVEFVAGYPDADVPAKAKHLVCLMVARLYAARGELLRSDLVEDPIIKEMREAFRVWGM
jgi:uncharacterized phiE125 gp8 family phage protein